MQNLQKSSLIGDKEDTEMQTETKSKEETEEEAKMDNSTMIVDQTENKSAALQSSAQQVSLMDQDSIQEVANPANETKLAENTE